MEIRFQRIFLVALIVGITPILSVNAFADNSAHTAQLNEENYFLATAFMMQEKADGDSDEYTDDTELAQVERREVLDDLLDNENFEIGLQLGFISVEDFESNLWVSGHFSYHINENFYAKALYGYAKAGETSFERLANVPPLLTHEQRKLKYYGLNIGYNLMPGEVFINKELAFNSLFSVEVGGGSTEFAGNNQFTVNLTANYRVFLTDWLTWDISMSDYIFDTSITGERKTTHNLNFATGFAYYF